MTSKLANDSGGKRLMRVLIVDDDGSMRALLSSLIASNGYEVVAALEDGAEIMATIRQKSPDIVCLDYQLPGRDGLAILHEINETFPELDVVFMTGSDDRSVETKAADEGAAGFLRKPFSMKQIIDELNEVSDARRHAGGAKVNSASEGRDEPPSASSSAPSDDASPKADAVVAKIVTNVGEPAPFNLRNVVVVDDNGSVRLLLKGLLAELGLNVVYMASNGADAVNAAKIHQPGILCLDVEMPVMSGIDALPLIREVSPRTSVVMVTAFATREFVEKAASLGAKGYIVKPVRPAYLEAFIRKLIK